MRRNAAHGCKIGRMESHIEIFVAIVFAAAGVVKGIVGLGLPTVSVSLLGLAMAPSSAAALIVVPSLVTNVAQCIGHHTRELLRRFGTLWIAILLGCLFTPAPTIASSSAFGRICLAVLLVAHGVWGLSGMKLPNPGGRHWWVSPVIGYATGVMTVATGVFVIPVSAYLQSLQLQKEQMVQALGFTFTVCTIGLALRLGLDDVPLSGFGWPAAIALGCALLGMAWGLRMRRRWDHKTFNRATLASFVVLGVLMLAKEV
jgi:uncharacterized membrane protein YfcA